MMYYEIGPVRVACYCAISVFLAYLTVKFLMWMAQGFVALLTFFG